MGQTAPAQPAPPTPTPKASAPAPQTPTNSPATEMKRTKIVIESIKGTGDIAPKARHKNPGEEKAKLTKVGDELVEGARLQLGPLTTVTIRVAEAQLLTFDQAGAVVVLQARNDGTTNLTYVKLEQGRVSFDVKKVNFANDVKIETPEMTLAIKGTSGGIECTPGQPTLAYGDLKNTGRIELAYATGAQVTMTRSERSDSSTPDPATKLARDTSVDTTVVAARDKDEVRVIKRTVGGQSTGLDVGPVNEGSKINLLPMVKPPVVTPPGRPTRPG